MKNLLSALFALALLFSVPAAFSQTNTFPPSGPVGVGTLTPDEALHVSGSSTGFGAHIGNLFVGVWDGGSSYSVFTHNALKLTATSYALLQSSTGSTFLNAASDRKVYIRNNNVNVATIDAAGLDVNGIIMADELILAYIPGTFDPSSPPANSIKLFVRQNPNGTLQLWAKFPSGATEGPIIAGQ